MTRLALPGAVKVVGFTLERSVQTVIEGDPFPLQGYDTTVDSIKLRQRMAKSTAPHRTSRGRTPAQTGSQSVMQDSSQPVPRRFQASDVTIAKAIAKAVRATPGVVDLSPGLMALAATYGANERLVGVVVRHSGPRDTAVEVHVTVAMEAAAIVAEQSDVPSRSARSKTAKGVGLSRVANQVREAVDRVMQDMGLDLPSAVDVLIDDIQMSA